MLLVIPNQHVSFLKLMRYSIQICICEQYFMFSLQISHFELRNKSYGNHWELQPDTLRCNICHWYLNSFLFFRTEYRILDKYGRFAKSINFIFAYSYI